MRIVAALTDPVSIRRYLEGTSQSAELPEIASARSRGGAEGTFLVRQFQYHAVMCDLGRDVWNRI